jgi:hypothetical protein
MCFGSQQQRLPFGNSTSATQQFSSSNSSAATQRHAPSDLRYALATMQKQRSHFTFHQLFILIIIGDPCASRQVLSDMRYALLTRSSATNSRRLFVVVFGGVRRAAFGKHAPPASPSFFG